jgi:MFS transporter, CP family, cyanate transporter
MLGALCGVYFAFGVVTTAIPPMIDEVRADLDLSRSAVGVALGAWPLIYVVTAPVAGRVIDRIGVHRAVVIGMALMSASVLIQAAAQGLFTLWVAIAIFGVGGPLISASAPKMVADWFVARSELPRTVGLYTSAPALGGVVTLILTNSVLLPLLGSWRTVLVAESIVCIVATVAWVVVHHAAPEPPADDHVPVVAADDGSVRSLLASPGVRLALALGVGSFFLSHGLANWLPNVLEVGSDLSANAASSIAAASLAIGIASRVVIPGLANADRRALLLNVVMGAMALSLAAMTLGSVPVTVVAVFVLGVRSALNSLVILVLIDADGVTRANMGTVNGLWFSVVEIGGAAGPLAIGAISDTSAGFDGALLVLAAVLVVMIIVNTRADRAR